MKNIVKIIPRALIGGFVTCLLAFISFNCIETPLSPVAPMSDIVLQGISIIDITKYVSEMTGKSPGMVINGDGTMSYIPPTLYSTPVKIDSLKLKMSPSSQRVTVGRFSVDGFSISEPINATSISPALNGTLPLVPAQSFSLAPIILNDTIDFDYVQVSAGTMSLSITNNLPIDIDFTKPIVLRNNMGGDLSTIASFSIPPLAANGGAATVPADIAGKILRGLMTSDSIQLHTPGSTIPVTFTSGSGLSVAFQSSSLLADSAVAKIPQQTLYQSDTSSVVMDDTVIVEDADFSAGLFQLQIINNLGIDVGARFVIDQLWKNGLLDTIDKVISGGTIYPLTYDAKQYSIRPIVKPTTGIGSQCTYAVGIKTINSNGIKKKITENDFIEASLIPGTPLILKSITGKIKTQLLAVNSAMASNINFKDANKFTADSIDFKGIGLTIKFPMTGGYPMDYDLTVIAKLKGSIVGNPIVIKSGQNGFQRIYPSDPVIPISNAPGFDDFISKFFPASPDSFYIIGTVTLNPEFPLGTSYTTHDTSKIYPSFDVNFPVTVGITNGKVTDVVGFTKAEVPKEFSKSVEHGTITFNFFNRIPLKMGFSATFLGNYDTPSMLDDSLFSIVPSNLILAGQIDANGYSSAQTVSKVSITLDGDQMALFNKADSLRIQFQMATGTSGQVVKVRQSDYIRVYAKGDITYTMNKP
jgi:hypothetical protein